MATGIEYDLPSGILTAAPYLPEQAGYALVTYGPWFSDPDPDPAPAPAPGDGGTDDGAESPGVIIVGTVDTATAIG